MGILDGQIPLAQLRCQDDGLPSDSSIAQKRTEESVLEHYVPYAPNNVYRQSLESIRLERENHVPYLKRGLNNLSRWMVSLDASKPWLTYWILHSLDLLEAEITPEIIERCISTLAKWQHPEGGFSGGPDQIAHLATTYAAVNSLAILGTKEAYDVIDRESLYEFLMRMKQPDGSFTMHTGGEIDIRGSYCALSVATLTNLLTPELTKNCSDFICRAQTYEGGIGPYPGKEAHNGYTFCGVAAMEILGHMEKFDMDKLIKWCSERQMGLEGGFQGRTNKLVDGCYSFWGAGSFPLLHTEMLRQGKAQGFDYMFDREALQEYILLCCQSKYGGLIDKPGKGADYYHTCYCLSGLSTAQHLITPNLKKAQLIRDRGASSLAGGIASLMWTCANEFTAMGEVDNILAPTHPIHNIGMDKTRSIIHYFYREEIDPIKDILPKDEEPAHEEEEKEDHEGGKKKK
ncbi:terpenoid cyclases/protein prenyltransferase alpha-alpha toroid [Zychaea mexicana]|uniref:terpenoid cyclases/protein prenyltransferase alpha-alpha toroid n=1 Tax=Zychaea mexicana TaxID=64656 RepID=UPI0022FE5818|nr:terpenoid cyclases/protein prenyltransferase alpha-alpha toroid [Zychaea mexicana]KAI9497746.1 terpenoid cyclases/protein prenyltransferase alpha-alpha toroid [Zychaea mexicana]